MALSVASASFYELNSSKCISPKFLSKPFWPATGCVISTIIASSQITFKMAFPIPRCKLESLGDRRPPRWYLASAWPFLGCHHFVTDIRRAIGRRAWAVRALRLKLKNTWTTVTPTNRAYDESPVVEQQHKSHQQLTTGFTSSGDKCTECTRNDMEVKSTKQILS